MAGNLFIFNFDNSMMKDTLKKNPYVYFILKLSVLAAVVLLLDFSTGNMLRYFYFKQQSGLLYRTTYSIEKTNEDILILGSSRANHHYDTRAFEKSFGQSCYNAGRDGQFIFYHYAVLKAVLKRYTPKMIILDFTASDLRNDSRGYDRLSVLFPYYKNHPELRSIAELKGPFEKWKLCSATYPYNSSLFTIAVGNADFNKKRREDINGFLPLNREWNKPIVTDSVAPEYLIDSVKLNCYESFIKDCVQRKVKLYIVNSPTYRKFTYTDPYVILASKIAASYQVDFFNYLEDSTFLNCNGKLFSDGTHLNSEGAAIFSGKIIDSIISLEENSTAHMTR